MKKGNLLTRLLAICLVMIMSMGMVMTVGVKDTAAAYTRYVTVDFLNIREKASGSSDIIGKYYWKDEVVCIGTSGDWTKVEKDELVGYVATKYLVKKVPTVTYKDQYIRYAKQKIQIRKTPSTGSASIGSYAKGKKVKCYGTCGDWTYVKRDGDEGFVLTKYLSKNTVSTSKGKEVAAYAKKFVGNPYKYGGTSLTNGADCSGFTQSVFKHFGKKIPRTSGDQRSAGTGVKFANRKAGDLICYSGHVGIYIGDNKIVHASNSKPYPKGGIKISSVYIMDVVAVRRIVK